MPSGELLARRLADRVERAMLIQGFSRSVEDILLQVESLSFAGGRELDEGEKAEFCGQIDRELGLKDGTLEELRVEIQKGSIFRTLRFEALVSAMLIELRQGGRSGTVV